MTDCAKCGKRMEDPVLIFSKARVAVSLVCLECAEGIRAAAVDDKETPPVS